MALVVVRAITVRRTISCRPDRWERAGYARRPRLAEVAAAVQGGAVAEDRRVLLPPRAGHARVGLARLRCGGSTRRTDVEQVVDVLCVPGVGPVPLDGQQCEERYVDGFADTPQEIAAELLVLQQRGAPGTGEV